MPVPAAEPAAAGRLRVGIPAVDPVPGVPPVLAAAGILHPRAARAATRGPRATGLAAATAVDAQTTSARNAGTPARVARTDPVAPAVRVRVRRPGGPSAAGMALATGRAQAAPAGLGRALVALRPAAAVSSAPPTGRPPAVGPAAPDGPRGVGPGGPAKAGIHASKVVTAVRMTTGVTMARVVTTSPTARVAARIGGRPGTRALTVIAAATVISTVAAISTETVPGTVTAIRVMPAPAMATATGVTPAIATATATAAVTAASTVTVISTVTVPGTVIAIRAVPATLTAVGMVTVTIAVDASVPAAGIAVPARRATGRAGSAATTGARATSGAGPNAAATGHGRTGTGRTAGGRARKPGTAPRAPRRDRRSPSRSARISSTPKHGLS